MATRPRPRSHSRDRSDGSARSVVRAAPARRRLAPEERRHQLLGIAADLLSRKGVEAVQFGELAARAGVTRQLVYKLFGSRQELIQEVIEDFATDVEARFAAGAERTQRASLHDATHVFVEAVCDSIEAKGAGAWRLLDARGPDSVIARRGRALQARLVAPWLAGIAMATGASDREVGTVARMLVAAGRAVLEEWYGGTLTREDAVRDTTRGVSALLEAFTVKTTRATGTVLTARRRR